MINPSNYAAIKYAGAVANSIFVTVRGALNRTAHASTIGQPRDARTPIPLLVPQFWWLVLNTVRLKWQHRRANPERYTDSLDRFYTGNTTRTHVAVYGDAYRDVRPLVADMAALTPGDTVLDVASGRGYQAAEFARRGHSVTSVELVHDRARTARDSHRGCRLTAVTGDAGHLPFKDDAFDVVVISLGLHCMPSETRLRVLREFSRVARKRVVILEPRPPKGWLSRHFYAAVGQILDESLYFWDFAPSDFDAHLAHADLGLLKLQRCFHQLLAVYVCRPEHRRAYHPALPVSRKPATEST